MRIYLDNAATSYPKAPGVGAALKHFIEQIGDNANRSGYHTPTASDEMVYETRELLAEFFNFPTPENVVFTLNITYALNILLKGSLEPGDHVVVSSMEHNAVMRPLMQLQRQGVQVSRMACDQMGRLAASTLCEHIQPNTKMVIVTHASNVSGTILPIEELGAICEERNLFFIVDTAQTAGLLEIDYQRIKADALAFTGHKGLLAPQGIGGFLISAELAAATDALISGGTGSLSESEEVPPYLPDKFEAGTLNLPAICGLKQAIEYVMDVGLASLRNKELRLAELLLEGLGNIKGVHIAGLPETDGRLAVVSADFEGYDNGEVAYYLQRDYAIQTRCGLHCAPSAHKTLGTFPQGTVRFSPGPFNTEAEIQHTISAVNKVLQAIGSNRR